MHVPHPLRPMPAALLLVLCVATTAPHAETTPGDMATEFHQRAVAALEAGDLEAARDAEARALHLAQKLRPPEHPEIGVLALNAATLFTATGQAWKAVDAIEVAVANYEVRFGKEAKELSGPLRSLAEAQTTAGSNRSAHETHERRLAIVAATSGEESPIYAEALRDAATTDLKTGHIARGRERLLHAAALYEPHPPSPPEARVHIELAMTVLHGHTPQSVAARKEALDRLGKGVTMFEELEPLGSRDLIQLYTGMIERLHAKTKAKECVPEHQHYPWLSKIEKRLALHEEVARARGAR